MLKYVLKCIKIYYDGRVILTVSGLGFCWGMIECRMRLRTLENQYELNDKKNRLMIVNGLYNSLLIPFIYMNLPVVFVTAGLCKLTNNVI